MSGHDEAIEAARLAMSQQSDDLDPTAEQVARSIAAFLRAWEPKFGHVWNQVSVKVAANHTADELEGKA